MCKNKNEKTIYIIKLKGTVPGWDLFREFLTKSIDENEKPAYYNMTSSSSDADCCIVDQMEDGKEYRCAILDYEGDKITRLYWTMCWKYHQNERKAIHCRLKYMSTEETVIENFKYNLQLNLEKDFPADSYINCETSVSLIEQMRKFEQPPYKRASIKMTYDPFAEEERLSELAQKNQYCRRKYHLTGGVQDKQNRGEFQRDYDRILYSKAFRRMVDKAQVFSSSKGDHYRTRMTHTLMVCQIARSICRILELNSSLAEAIAIGHDLGHTPFGHEGERTLHAILTGQKGFEVENLPVKSDHETDGAFPYGGFKHNYQSVRVATALETQYLEIDGLDLSEQTLNGMWMHTEKKEGLQIGDFSDGFLSDEGECAFTLEGQVVAIADEIAQRSHDIDDAFASHLITPSDFVEYLGLNKTTKLKGKIDGIFKTWQKVKDNNRLFSDENDVICARISSVIVDHFIDDVCTATDQKIKNYSAERFEKDNYRVHEQLVSFSDDGHSLCKYLDNIIRKKVLTSREVTLFDQNGSGVVLALFRAYYKNPMLLHSGTLNRIWNEFRRENLETIDFEEGAPKIVKSEWERITTTPIAADERQRSIEQKVLLKKRIILVRGICDFISGMTDSYALNEYHKIIF